MMALIGTKDVRGEYDALLDTLIGELSRMRRCRCCMIDYEL